MSGPDTVVLEITRVEAAHLSGLVAQFRELVDEAATEDPAVQRLVPDAYPDDRDAAEEFRALTQDDLLSRRRSDADQVLADLAPAAAMPDNPSDAVMIEPVVLALDAEHAQAWLRTLAAVRLVLAIRLGVAERDEHDDGDPRFGIYDWVGYRLDGLVRAVSGEQS
jgi:Domain of unknown function (DUF2017)